MDISTPLFAMVASFIVACISAPFYIKFLRKLKFGQQIITEYGPTWHKKKQGIPTMGCFIFATGIIVAYLIFAFKFYVKGDSGITNVLPSPGITALIISILLGFMGFADDLVKIKKKHNQGLTEIQKLILQILIGVAFLLYDAIRTGGRTSVEIPFIGYNLELSYFYYVFALIAFVGFVNAMNLTDGVDGLATTVTIPVAAAFMLIAISKGAADLSVLSGAMLGGCIAFLVFNWNPAKVIMGDTGSMFLGGLVVTLAFALDIPLMLIIIGFVYLAEAVSVMIQVTYFKITKGKRLFKMTPIHHHFELCKWSEKKICAVFGCVSLIMCSAAVLWMVF